MVAEEALGVARFAALTSPDDFVLTAVNHSGIATAPPPSRETSSGRLVWEGRYPPG
jgi:hypothetical protein